HSGRHVSCASTRSLASCRRQYPDPPTRNPSNRSHRKSARSTRPTGSPPLVCPDRYRVERLQSADSVHPCRESAVQHRTSHTSPDLVVRPNVEALLWYAPPQPRNDAPAVPVTQVVPLPASWDWPWAFVLPSRPRAWALRRSEGPL